MKEIFDCVFTANGMAYATGVVIFLITLFLVSRKIIGFTVTLLFLVFALIASLGVANQDLIRSYFDNLSKGTSADSKYRGAEGTSKEVPLTAQLQQAFSDLKTEFDVVKKKVQDYFEQSNADKDKEKKDQQDQSKK